MILLMVCIFLLFLDDLLIQGGLYLRYPHTYGLDIIFALLLTPLLYLAVLKYTCLNYRWKWRYLLHFGLVYFYLILNGEFYFLPASAKVAAYELDQMGVEWIVSISVIALFLQAFTYGIRMLKTLQRHRVNIQHYTAKGNDVDLRWLYNVVLIFVIWMFFWLVALSYPQLWVEEVFSIISLTGIVFIGHLAVQQKDIFTHKYNGDNNTPLTSSSTKTEDFSKYEPLTADEIDHFSKTLLHIMEEDKLFKNPDLTLPGLAQQLQVPAYKLTFLLNEHFGKNFSSFINEYRADEAQQILANPDNKHFNILRVAYEAGYSSKTVFNSHFKKVTGMSPTAFKKQYS